MTTVFSSWRRAIFLGTLIATTIFSSVTDSQALYYWDTNGSDPGPGSDLNGTWGEDPNWSTNRNGTSSTVSWPADVHAIFAAPGGPNSAYTVTVDGTRFVGDMHF